jgi:GNAT superfamily N-acetyltransferase
VLSPSTHATPLGQDTLVESWRRLAETSPRAFVTRLDVGVAAVFPEWSVLNNAIIERDADPDEATVTLRNVYRSAGIGQWAAWVASPAVDLAAHDVVARLEGFRRDTTTLIMQASLDEGLARNPRIVRTSVAIATQAADEPVPMSLVDEAEVAGERLEGWVLVDGDLAVSGAWSLIHDGDCGVYSVGTVPAWRRRGYARALVEGILGDAFQRRATTASLQSTPGARSLYAAVGFRPVGRYEEWVPVEE